MFYYEFLQNQKHDLDVFFIGLLAFNFLLLTAVGFLISHRIAGPIQKIKSFLETGSPDELKFRKKDFFPGLSFGSKKCSGENEMRMTILSLLIFLSACGPAPVSRGDEYVLVEFAGRLEEESETFKKLQE